MAFWFHASESVGIVALCSIFYAAGCWYGHLWSIMSNTMRCSVRPACGGSYGRIRPLPLWHGGRPVGVHMVTYGPFPYGAAAGLWELIWSHGVLFPYGTARPDSSRGADKPPSLDHGHIRTYMDRYGWVWSPMSSLIIAGYLWEHTDTYGYIWMCMVTYVCSDFRKATLMVTYKHIWAYMDEYDHLGALWFSQATYGGIRMYMSTYGWVWLPMGSLIFASYLW